MPIVWVTGLENELISALAGRLRHVEVSTFPDEPPDGLTPDAVVIGHAIAEDPHQLDRIRDRFPGVPLIFCLQPHASGTLVRRLIVEVGASDVLFHPVGHEALAERIAALLGISLGPAGESVPPEPRVANALRERLAELWDRSRRRFTSLDEIEKAGAALADRTLDPGLRQRAARAAHQLSGTLGAFGVVRGSRFAREIERMLAQSGPPDPQFARTFSQVAAALAVEIERASVLETPPDAANQGTRVMLVSADPELAARLSEQAAARGWAWRAVDGLTAARAALADSPPALVVLDFEAALLGETLQFLEELAARQPALPAALLMSGESFMDRVEVARRGGRAFIPRRLPAGEIAEALAALMDRLHGAPARVLAVDDDPAVIEQLDAVLRPHGIEVRGLLDPSQLWDALEGPPPDLLLLDIEMPVVNGLDLCQVVRNDLRWGSIPILFLTAFTDRTTVQRVFAGGADDFVPKPIVGPELVTRIRNRLERTRLRRRLSEVDRLSGLASRPKGRGGLEDFLQLAARYGQPMGLGAVSIDSFRRINHEEGVIAADEVVRWLGRRLADEFRSEDVTARWGGNDFVIGMYGLDRPGSLRRLHDLIEICARTPFAGRDGRNLRVTLSGGVAAFPEDGADLEALIRVASDARRRAAVAGGNGITSSTANPADGVTDVVVVTADDALAALLVDSLESAGLRTSTLRNGLLAARMLAGSERSLRMRALVLDLEIPGLDGMALLRTLASDGILEATRAFVLAPPAVGRDALAALELGAEEQIAKPLDVPVLAARVLEILSSGAATRRARV